jgi:hypothetical protein
MSCLQIGLSSGREMLVNKVRLFPKEKLAKAMSLRAQGIQRLGGVSTGLGFLGSPGWVIGGTLVVGAIESWLSDKSQKEGVEMLAQAEALALEARNSGAMIDVGNVMNIGRPVLRDWLANVVEEEKDKWGFVSRTEGTYVLDDEPFIEVMTEDGGEFVRWSDVSTVRLVG